MFTSIVNPVKISVCESYFAGGIRAMVTAKVFYVSSVVRKIMTNKVIINTERCKGCGLCVTVCPKSCIAISSRSNKKGYFPAEIVSGDCSACAMCAIVCSETIIEVYREAEELKQKI